MYFAVACAWTAIYAPAFAGAAGAATAAALSLFVVWPEPFIRLFSSDPGVLETGVVLLLVCAAFQPFDGLQAVATGALRGVGDTRSPMVANFTGHWLIGLPIAVVGGLLAVAVPVVGIPLLVLAIGALAAIGAACSGVFDAALYRYATTGESSGAFSEDDLNATFRPRRGATSI